MRLSQDLLRAESPSIQVRAYPPRLWIILGDQLDPKLPEHFGWHPERDSIWMAEVAAESLHPVSHRARSLLFLSAMRHTRERWRAAGFSVYYRELGKHTASSLGEALRQDLPMIASQKAHRLPLHVYRFPAGDLRLETEIQQALQILRGTEGLFYEPATHLLEEPHFLFSQQAFAEWAEGRKEWRLEWFYRYARKRTKVLMEGEQPVGGRWNFDSENRHSFGRRGPPAALPKPVGFPSDTLTREARQDLAQHLPQLIGSWEAFDWPVTAEQAEAALQDFLTHRLPAFGRYQDAMWSGEPWLYHSRLSSALNLKLLDPRRVLYLAEEAYRSGHAPLASVEGFIRQILGWREYVRGLYVLDPSFWHTTNALQAHEPLPSFYWTGDTAYRCLAEVITQTLRYGYAHHIQRLMVVGLFALLVGVAPKEISDWFLAVYVDAVEWVEIPNVIGMSQYADGGRMASKPYVASGKYIQRMSNYCTACPYDPSVAVGPKACPFTTLYWDFLVRHKDRFAEHPRTALQWRSLERLSPAEVQALRQQADQLRRRLQQPSSA